MRELRGGVGEQSGRLEGTEGASVEEQRGRLGEQRGGKEEKRGAEEGERMGGIDGDRMCYGRFGAR